MAAEKRGIPADEVDMTNMNAFLIQDGTYIDASRDEMIAAYGSNYAYVEQGLGLDMAALQQLRNEIL